MMEGFEIHTASLYLFDEMFDRPLAATNSPHIIKPHDFPLHGEQN